MSLPKLEQANFTYSAPANDAAGLPLTLSIFADRPHLRGEMREDALAAGFRITEASDLAGLLGGKARALGDLVLVDCPEVDGRALAALARLDMRAGRCGAHLVVSTSVEALDDVFGCMDQSGPQILVDPGRAERVVALGHALASLSDRRLREMSEQDRLTLLRLSEQVGRIAERLDRLNASVPGLDGDVGVLCFETPKRGFSGRDGEGSGEGLRATRPPLPDPRLVRRIIRQRQLRARFLDGELFADPAWDMLLDLTAARAEHLRVSVSSLCIASSVPATTALRWIGQMIEAGLFERVEDEADRRRAFISLSDRAADAMARYFAELGKAASQLI